MKKFLSHIAIISIIIAGMLLTADYAFSTIYKNRKPRTKIALAYKGEVKDYDVIFLGSSRANNHFVPKLFIDKGYVAYNYGMSGSRLEESALLLELLLEKGTKIKNIILEVDLNINTNGYSEGTRAAFYPYLKESQTIRNYYKDTPDFKNLYYIPFYRFIKYDAKIGFREFFFTMADKPTNALMSEGFTALKGIGTNMHYDLSDYQPKKNIGYERIKKVCQDKGINLIVITTPMCENVKNKAYFDEVIKLYPEIHNLENVVNKDEYFSSCGHMNEKGAFLFTKYVLNNFFK